MRPEKRIKIALIFVLFFLCAGTLGYVVIENYNLVDALYMTVITVSTVGYGEIQPLSGVGRIFTVVLILLSVGSLAILAGAFSEMLIERSANPNRWKRLMEKKIAKLSGHVIICGHGRVGAAAAKHFHSRGCSFVILERLEGEVKKIRDMGFYVLEGDGTREESLLRANIKNASSLLAVMNSDPDNLFAVLTARELNPTLHIIARTDDPGSESRMLRAGADSTISPFISAGKRVAEKLMKQEGSVEVIVAENGSDKVKARWLMVGPGNDLNGLTIADAQLKIGAEIIGLRSAGVDCLMPDRDITVHLNDELLFAGALQESKKLDVVRKKICIIDDNPVIVRLYTRLFQKAGFQVLSALTGADGLVMVQKERPDGLVVDYHLPDMTGIQICEKVRQITELQSLKIFLFTADDQETVKTSASSAGVDRVVIKSPEAREIVSLVSAELL